MYSNSIFLELLTNKLTVDYIFMLGAAVSILGFLIAPIMIRRLGNYYATLYLVVIQILLFYGMITTKSTGLFVAFFILQTAVIAIIGLCLDIFLETYTDSMHIGTIRGMYTATLNASWIIAPLIGWMIINGDKNYHNTYVAALWMLFPLLYLIYTNFPRFKDPNYTHLSPWQLIKHISHNKNWIKLFSANAILQVFYAWMTIYCTIYLSNIMGFNAESMGTILAIMLIPFALIQYPLGRLSDRKYGEKKIMIAGFTLLGVSTVVLAFIHIPSVAVWAGILFVTRIGAAAAEIMIETYFFKTVSMRDTAALGLFRVTRPISYLIAPLLSIIAGLILGKYFTGEAYMFAVIGIVVLLAIIPLLSLKDTD